MRSGSIAVVASLAVVAACASMETPPGGPPDAVPPTLVGVTPDTGAVNVRARTAVFQFDEVVSERPRTVTRLDDLFLISPATSAPDVDWNRRAIAVRPRDGWRANTTYTVTMMPGLADLRGNSRTDGASVTFSTGPELARSSVRGIVFDWVAGRVTAGAYVEAISHPDSTVYIATTDSGGTFVVRNIPPGDYTVRALADANRNREVDLRELWDSTRITVADSARVELLTHLHDTIPPRIDQVTVRDTFTIRVTTDRPLDPTMTIDPSLFTLLASDSAVVPIAEARPAQVYERLQAERDRARADSIARAAPPVGAAGLPRTPDSLRTVIAVTPSRPSPTSELIIVVSRALQPGASYRLRVRELRGLMGTTRGSERDFKVPEPPRAPGTPATPPPAGAGTPPPATVPPPPRGPR